MIIDDKIYGKVEIKENVLIEIINSSTMQRLKKIRMGGYYPAYPEFFADNLSRYSHSVGVLLLLKRFNASIEEQIAGLIHDVSHTAFSHTFDYVIENSENEKSQNFQDDSHNDFIKNSDIYTILKKYKYDVDFILNDENFPLKENNIPDICSDRIDYSIRNLFYLNMITEEEKDFILNNLIVCNNSFIMRNYESAVFFAKIFWKLDEVEFSGLKSAVTMGINALMLREAIKDEIITIGDLIKKTDVDIIDIIEKEALNNPNVKKYYDYLHLSIDNFESNPKKYIRHLYCKIRKIDPYFLENNVLKRVSDVDLQFKKNLNNINKYSEYYLSCKKDN